MNEISFAIDNLNIDDLESSIYKLGKRVGINKGVSRHRKPISCKKELSKIKLISLIKEIELRIEASSNALNEIKSMIQLKRESFQTEISTKNKKIENEIAFAEQQLEKQNGLLMELNNASPENCARVEMLLSKYRSSIKELDLKKSIFNNDMELLKRKKKNIEHKIKDEKSNSTNDLIALQQRIDQVNTILDQKSKDKVEMNVSMRKYELLQLNERIRLKNKAKMKIDKQKAVIQNKKDLTQKIRDERLKLRDSIIKLESKQKKLIPLIDVLKETREEKIKVNTQLTKAIDNYKSLSKHKKECKKELKSVIKEIENENNRADLIEDMFFNDTNNMQIDISGPLQAEFDQIVPPINKLKGIKLLRQEIDTDINEIQKELIQEQKEIRLLKKRINEQSLEKIEKSSSVISDFLSSDYTSKEELEIKSEELEWKIKQTKESIEEKKKAIASIRQINDEIPLSGSVSLFNSEIEIEIEKWRNISSFLIGASLSKWNSKISNL